MRQGKVFFLRGSPFSCGAGRTFLDQWLFVVISFWQSLIPNVINMTEHKCQYFNVYWMQLLSKIRNCSLPKDDIDISVDVTWWRYWSIGNFLLCFSIGCFSWIFQNFVFQSIFSRKEGNAEVLEGAFRRSGLRRIRSNWFKKANRSDASPMKWCSVVLHCCIDSIEMILGDWCWADCKYETSPQAKCHQSSLFFTSLTIFSPWQFSL